MVGSRGTWIVDRGCARAVGFGSALAAGDIIPAGFYLALHRIDDCGGFVRLKVEAGALREHVLRVRVAADVTTGHGKVAALKADRHCRRQVVGRGEFPVGASCNGGMIARVIVGVLDQRIEGHAAE